MDVDNWGVNTRKISATVGGLIDLSGVTMLRGGSGTSGGLDSVRVVIPGGGRVTLLPLQQIVGYVTFATNAPTLSLASLVHAVSVSYELPDNAILLLPELLTQTGGGFAITPGTTVETPKLEGLTSASVSFGGTGTLNAPNLTDFGASTLTLSDAGQVVTTGGLAQIDNARFLLSNGTVFDQIVDTDYVITGSGIANTDRKSVV